MGGAQAVPPTSHMRHLSEISCLDKRAPTLCLAFAQIVQTRDTPVWHASTMPSYNPLPHRPYARARPPAPHRSCDIVANHRQYCRLGGKHGPGNLRPGEPSALGPGPPATRIDARRRRRAAVAAEFARPEIAATIQPGTRVALTAGSRGIDRIAEVDRRLRSPKCDGSAPSPFIVPAMGSHGGATAEGQLELLAHYGITEEAMGCPIRASMETVHLGEVEDDVPVYFDRIAYEEADAVIPVGRVKPHTDFHGPIESGLMKMIAIGLGKQKGADTFHARGFPSLPPPDPGGRALHPQPRQHPLRHRPGRERPRPPRHHRGRPRRPDLGAGAGAAPDRPRSWLGRLPGERIDVLLIDEIGKDISGDGADPNVINRDISGDIAQSELAPQARASSASSSAT